MKYLESVKLVQFFLFEKQDIRLREITGIFGPNASGKSSMVDAVQIAMFGANRRMVSMNAQADEHATTRTIRSYCLGMHDESKCARDNATTYITLVWRDSVTNEPMSMGVCLYASIGTEGHEVRGRYLVHGVELAMHDHLELIGDQERPRTWETFRHQLVERSKVSGEDPFYTDSERYIRAALHALRGASGVPAFEAFKSAFRFALRMRFDKSVDQIVRTDVLEAHPTNIQKFKDVTDSFRRLKIMVEQVRAKINDGEKVEAEFAKAAHANIRAVTWGGLSSLVAQQDAVEAMGRATEGMQSAEQALVTLRKEYSAASESLQQARDEEKQNRDLRIDHPAHQQHGALQSAISNAAETETKKAKEVRNGLALISRTVKEAANSPHLQDRSAVLGTVIKSIDAALPTSHEMTREALSALLRPSVKAASSASSELFNASMGIARMLEDANSTLKLSESSLQRIKDGRSRLSLEAELLLAELNDNGLHPTPVCDLVRISDPEWQPVIEAYLGRNVEALLLEKNEAGRAFSIYRGLTGSRTIYGAKIVDVSKQGDASCLPGTVAELIEGNHLAAVSNLRRRFGDMRRASTDEEALAGSRTLTKDGMIVQGGEYERIRPLAKGQLKIGGGDESQKGILANEIGQLRLKIQGLEQQLQAIKGLVESLGLITNESSVMKVMLEACDEMHVARATVASLTNRLNDTADAEYVRLGQLEQEWAQKAQKLQPEVEQLQLRIGRAESEFNQCVVKELRATEKWKQAKEATEAATGIKEYDRDYASVQWDALLEKHDDQYQVMISYCTRQKSNAESAMHASVVGGSRELATFREKYREQGAANTDDWRKDREWMADRLKLLRDTELGEFEAQMNDAYRASQETFRADVAIALSNNFDHLNTAMNRLNQVLMTCPVFSNGERYQFKRTVRPQLKRLQDFVKDIAVHGPGEDLFGGAGETPEEFRQLLDDKVSPGATGIQNPLDDYREFFEFDVDILREDSITKVSTVVGSLSKRLGPGSGGEHRAPLYVIAGAALASAYRLDSGNPDGIRLMLLDEAFNKMDMYNIVATMRYLEQLGLQLFMASPGENQGILSAFLHRYYDILRDVENSAVMITGHDLSEKDREMCRGDLAEFNDELVAQELAAIKASRLSAEAEATA